MKYVYLLLTLVLTYPLHAQDITGKWVGNYGFSFGSTRPDKLVLDISLNNDSVATGMSHLHHGNDKYEHYYISGIYRAADSTLVIKEDSAVAVKLGFFATNVLGTYTMKLRYTDSSMRFEGRWKENGGGFLLMNSKVWLEKPIPRKNSDNIASTATDEKLERAINIQKFIEIDNAEKDSIKIMLVDNGQVDGDIVSLYMNDSMLLRNQQLTARSVVQYIKVDERNPLCKLLMVAENQGEIPPCTAHLTVITKKKTYQLELFSDAGTNGALQFFLKE
ncbi:MAG: hypothetical protein JNK00_01150 [Flavipsychrobacter sp.]|nr:hypothetical protein [Flavipsychrobacter sp.]